MTRRNPGGRAIFFFFFVFSGGRPDSISRDLAAPERAQIAQNSTNAKSSQARMTAQKKPGQGRANRTWPLRPGGAGPSHAFDVPPVLPMGSPFFSLPPALEWRAKSPGAPIPDGRLEGSWNTNLPRRRAEPGPYPPAANIADINWCEIVADSRSRIIRPPAASAGRTAFNSKRWPTGADRAPRIAVRPESRPLFGSRPGTPGGAAQNDFHICTFQSNRRSPPTSPENTLGCGRIRGPPPRAGLEQRPRRCAGCRTGRLPVIPVQFACAYGQ